MMAGDKNVVIAKVDATEEMDLGSKYDVSGYPTIKFFPAGASEPENYEGPREVADFISFLNEKAGTERDPKTGMLLPTAGRVAALDTVLSEAAFKVTKETVAALKKAVDELEGGAKEKGAAYLKAAEKVLGKGADAATYVAKEVQRLGGMLASKSIQSEKKAAFQLRQNVLRAFMPGTPAATDAQGEDDEL